MVESGLELYKKWMDGLVELSRRCVDADCVKQGQFPGAESGEINDVLKKLTPADRAVLAKWMLRCYQGAVHDVLDHMEWLQCCRGMKISIDGQTLASDAFEGFSCDYIGRMSGDWEWPE